MQLGRDHDSCSAVNSFNGYVTQALIFLGLVTEERTYLETANYKFSVDYLESIESKFIKTCKKAECVARTHAGRMVAQPEKRNQSQVEVPGSNLVQTNKVFRPPGICELSHCLHEILGES